MPVFENYDITLFIEGKRESAVAKKTSDITDDKVHIPINAHPDVVKNLTHDRDHLFEDEYIGEDGRIHKVPQNNPTPVAGTCPSCTFSGGTVKTQAGTFEFPAGFTEEPLDPDLVKAGFIKRFKRCPKCSYQEEIKI